MQSLAPPTPSPAASSFAGMLAALTTSKSSEDSRRPSWDDEDLADDVSTLSYENALRAHTRYRLLGPLDSPLDAPVDPGPVSEVEPNPVTPAALRPNLKCASITIRLSSEDCAQLRKRAAEAGLTISAYIRSCTFEAESLRTMVRSTLAELRSTAPIENGDDSKPVPERRPRWMGSLWPRSFFGHRRQTA